jgi:glucose-6-phosphate isomerase
LSVAISILNDPLRAQTEELTARFASERVEERLASIIGALPTELNSVQDPLVALGTETNVSGGVTKNSYGVLDLPRQWAAHPEWIAQAHGEIEAIRARIRESQDASIRFLIWAGMGGSIEDKSAFSESGLLRGGPRFYALDSTDPAKLKAIVHDMQTRSKLPMPELLRSTLVVGMAMGMTSFEPVLNIEALANLYERYEVDLAPNLVCMSLPGSLVDKFAESRGATRVGVQLDGENSTAGRHSGPLTRGSIYPLALAGFDLERWIAGAQLSSEDIQSAWRLAAFLHAQGAAGRDKVNLLLPKSWAGADLWTKQNFEESLGKSEEIGIKIVIGERTNLRHLHPADDPKQDRAFLAVQLRGEPHPNADALSELRRHHYPVAAVTFPRNAPLSTWMQFVHNVVFGLGYLRNMNFVTQPSVELYKAVAADIYRDGSNAEWNAISASQKQWTPERFADALLKARRKGASYAELTFFGDLRYQENGPAVRRLLDTSADRVFRSPFKMPVDVYEGPAMNHSYHEMNIGHGGGFSVLVTSSRQATFPAAKQTPDYHKAQFVATKTALERRGRAVVPLLIRDLERDSLESLERFFREVASLLPKNG